MKRLLYFLFCFLPSVSSIAQNDLSVTEGEDTVNILPWPANIQAQLDSLIAADPLLKTSQLGLMVYDLTADSTLYTLHHQQSMRPASTMKVVTAVTALNRLGGDYQLKTSFYYTGMITDRTLTGSLYCVGGMDPMFDKEELHDLVVRVRQMGIDTLRGSIVTDCSMKDTLRWGEGWCWDDDNPSLSPLQVGRNPYFKDRLISELISAGIIIDSLTLFEDRPPLDAIPLHTYKHNIDQLLIRMMKESDNYYAECLYYQLAASFGQRPANASHARSFEKQLVNQLGLNNDQFRFADGSGLSLYNYVSPELLTKLLRYARHTPVIYHHLLPSLPIAGQDGTLKKRMKKTSAEGNVRAKTGTLTGIISLAGYLTAANGHELCFTIINQGVMSARAARNFQDKICGILCDNYETAMPEVHQ